jgi:hypothetical protein
MLSRPIKHGSGAMPSAKDDVLELLKNLPDDVTLEDIQYHLQVLAGIRRGQQDFQDGRFVSHTQAREWLGQWLKS